MEKTWPITETAEIKRLHEELDRATGYAEWYSRIMREDGYVFSADEDGILANTHNPMRTLHCEMLEIEKQVRAIADLAVAQRHAGQLDKIRGLATDLVVKMIRSRTRISSSQAQLGRNHDRVFSRCGTPNRA